MYYSMFKAIPGRLYYKFSGNGNHSGDLLCEVGLRLCTILCFRQSLEDYATSLAGMGTTAEIFSVK